MASINGFLKKIFGSKAERDMKQIRPVLEKILAAYERIDKLSDDGLRAETERIKGVYSTLIPVLLAVCVIIFGLSIYLVFKADGKKRTAKNFIKSPNNF